VQHGASRRRESSLDMGKLQARANPWHTGIITRNEMRKAVRVRSSALCFSCKLRKNEELSMLVSGALPTVFHDPCRVTPKP
jgi:hypothetical protein